jgi:hypothetical protein
MGGRWGRRVVALAGLAGTLVVGATSASASSAAPGSGTGYVVNALAGTKAQVVLDGSVVQASAAPGTVVGPLTLTGGQHVLELRSESAAGVSARARFTVASGENLDVVAHQAADVAMTPVITVFRNDLSAVGPGKTRLVVSHVAVAEPADIRLDGKPYFRNVANAESLSVVVPAGSYSLDVVPTAGTDKTVLAPVRVAAAPGTLTRVFAFGNPEQNTSDAIVQVLEVPVVGAGKPSSVHTGDGGQAAEALVASPARTWGLVGAAVAGFALAGVAGTRSGVVRSARLLGSRPRP